MKKSVSFNYDVQLEGNVTGFAAIAATCAKTFDKIKSLFGNGNGCHSGIRANGVMHVEVVQSVEFSPEEAKIHAQIIQEQYNSLPENMDKLVYASKTFSDYLKSDMKDWLNAYNNVMDDQEEREKAKMKAEKERIEAEEKAKMETSAE